MPIYKGSTPINLASTTHTHTLSDITDAGTAAASDTGDFAAASHTHALGDLSDVDTGGATTGQVLEFDGADWVPATPSAGAAALNDLTDVSTAGATTGDVIVYNGSTWEPAAQSGGGEIVSDAENGVGENSVTNIIAITQAEYDALTPQSDTFYIITDATAGTDYIINPTTQPVKLFDDMMALYPVFGGLAGYWRQLQGLHNDHHGIIQGYTANQSWRRANLNIEPMIGRTVGEEALCEVYFYPRLNSNGAEISFGCWFGDGTEGLDSTTSGSGYGDICHVGLTCYGNPALPYWRRYHRDNEGTYQNSSESDLFSFAFTNNQWVRLGLHCKRVESLGVEYWEVTAYIDGTQAFTQNIYTDTGCPGFTIMLYNNADAVTSYYDVDWVNLEHSGRGTAVTHLNLEDL